MTGLVFYLFAGLIPLCLTAFYIGRRTASNAEKTTGERLYSRPDQYGWYTVIWIAAPSLAASLVFATLGATRIFQAPLSMRLTAFLVIIAFGLRHALKNIDPKLRANDFIEKTIKYALLAASMVSIITTLGIVLSIIIEAAHFFSRIDVWYFITGTHWNADTAFLSETLHGAAAQASFGSVPVFTGTFVITATALLIAVPIGLFSAVFMAEYASPAVRKVCKPALELLAGIPTVVYGFFAAATVSPMVVYIAAACGLDADFNNALGPGIVIGLMIIPLISSLTDDIIRSAPADMREASLALGMTRSETMTHIILPYSMPGIVSAVILAVSRAVGETMIVVMAAGLQPEMTLNPLKGMTTVTVQIVNALTGDSSFDNTETLSAFGLGFALLTLTLVLNLISFVVVRRFRKHYI